MITALESLSTTIAQLRTIATPVVDHRIMPFGIPELDDRLAGTR
jgi:protein ImuA